MERICIVCGKPISDDNDLRDQFGCHTDIHANCYPEVCAALDENKRLREVVGWYADMFCEMGKSWCGKLTDDQCAGCKARAALKEGQTNDR